MKNKNIQMSESLLIGLLLACVGGFLESYSFLCRDGVFANCQTGNLVLLAMYLVKADWFRVISYLIPIVAFIIGVILTEFTRIYAASHKLHWRQYIILLETVLLAAAGFIPSGDKNSIATTIIAFSCSMQVEAFRKIKGSIYATTMCTGNLRSGTFQLFHAIRKKDKSGLARARDYFSIIALFMLGAILGSFTTDIWGEKAIFFACALLLFVFFLLFIRPDESTETIE